MAEGLLKKKFNSLPLNISSAGIKAMVGYPAAQEAQAVMKARDIDITQHRAQQINKEMLIKSDIILVMEQQQKIKLEFDLPIICGRVLRIGQWQGFDIPDPYRRNKKVFEQTYILLEECIKKWETCLNAILSK